jgi:hypothetical protein
MNASGELRFPVFLEVAFNIMYIIIHGCIVEKSPVLAAT